MGKTINIVFVVVIVVAIRFVWTEKRVMSSASLIGATLSRTPTAVAAITLSIKYFETIWILTLPLPVINFKY